jgi:hypothetical protein
LKTSKTSPSKVAISYHNTIVPTLATLDWSERQTHIKAAAGRRVGELGAENETYKLES